MEKFYTTNMRCVIDNIQNFIKYVLLIKIKYNSYYDDINI
jgi:hypothetical protein